MLMMMLIDRPHHKRDGRKSERNHRKEKKITFPWKGQIKCQLNDERRKNRQSNQPRSEYPMNDGPREQQTLRCIYWESVRSTTIACRRLSRCESFFFGSSSIVKRSLIDWGWYWYSSDTHVKSSFCFLVTSQTRHILSSGNSFFRAVLCIMAVSNDCGLKNPASQTTEGNYVSNTKSKR